MTMINNNYDNVTITWTWRDVESLHPDWSEDQCKSYLMEVSKVLRDRSIELGWVILHYPSYSSSIPFEEQ